MAAGLKAEADREDAVENKCALMRIFRQLKASHAGFVQTRSRGRTPLGLGTRRSS
jgi:hypothetical protein